MGFSQFSKKFYYLRRKKPKFWEAVNQNQDRKCLVFFWAMVRKD